MIVTGQTSNGCVPFAKRCCWWWWCCCYCPSKPTGVDVGKKAAIFELFADINLSIFPVFLSLPQIPLFCGRFIMTRGNLYFHFQFISNLRRRSAYQNEIFTRRKRKTRQTKSTECRRDGNKFFICNSRKFIDTANWRRIDNKMSEHGDFD